MAGMVSLDALYAENTVKRLFSHLVFLTNDQCVFLNDSEVCTRCQGRGVISACIKTYGPRTELKMIEEELFPSTPWLKSNDTSNETSLDGRYVRIRPLPE